MSAKWDTVAIIGVGAIGGSIGLAVRRRRLARRVIGATRSAASADAALEIGAVDAMAASIEEAAADAELIVVCTPVGDIAGHVKRCAAAATRDQVLITDGGSTKLRLCQALVELHGASFVGSHPLAGTHQTGPRAARADLLQGRRVVMTPVAGVTSDLATAEIRAFWQSLGAEVVLLDADEHDRLMAYASHFPHLLASALAAATPSDALPHAASGWKDTTRIAQASPVLWEQILRDNRDHTLKALDDFEKTLASLKDAIAADDAAGLMELLEQGKQNRDAVGN